MRYHISFGIFRVLRIPKHFHKRCRDREEYYQDLQNYERAIAESERRREQDRIEHERVIAEKEQDYQRVAAENEKLRAELERLKKS